MFTLRAVAREASGKVGVVIARWPLQATSLESAKREVDQGRWVTGGVEPNGYEIVDGSSTVVARRSHPHGNRFASWHNDGPQPEPALSAAE